MSHGKNKKRNTKAINPGKRTPAAWAKRAKRAVAQELLEALGVGKEHHKDCPDCLEAAALAVLAEHAKNVTHCLGNMDEVVADAEQDMEEINAEVDALSTKRDRAQQRVKALRKNNASQVSYVRALDALAEAEDDWRDCTNSTDSRKDDVLHGLEADLDGLHEDLLYELRQLEAVARLTPATKKGGK